MVNNNWVVVDVESDGPSPCKYSVVCFAAVIVSQPPYKTFYGQTKPISKLWLPDALAISGFSREEHEKFGEPEKVMIEFRDWLKANIQGNPVFVSDNPAYDFKWIDYYFHYYLEENPFGFSGRRIGDMYAGFMKDASQANNWKRLRVTRHTHCPTDDAIGNVEALLKIQELGMKFPF